MVDWHYLKRFHIVVVFSLPHFINIQTMWYVYIYTHIYKYACEYMNNACNIGVVK